MSEIDLTGLTAVFPADDIEWRVGQCGKNSKGFWAKCLAYIDARAVMDRLDAVCGPGNWKTAYEYVPGGVICTLSVRIGADWVSKQDGSDPTDVEAFKGTISGALKRAGSAWGIGRYLYRLEEGWAKIVDAGAGGRYAKTKENEVFYWIPPALPAWALPPGDGSPSNRASGIMIGNGNTGDRLGMIYFGYYQRRMPEEVDRDKLEIERDRLAGVSGDGAQRAYQVIDEYLKQTGAPVSAPAPGSAAPSPGDFIIPFGKKFKDKRVSDVPRHDLESYIQWLESDAEKKQQPVGFEVKLLKKAFELHYSGDSSGIK